MLAHRSASVHSLDNSVTSIRYVLYLIGYIISPAISLLPDRMKYLQACRVWRPACNKGRLPAVGKLPVSRQEAQFIKPENWSRKLTIPSTFQKPWFAIHVKRRFERSVATNLVGKGYEQFLPTRPCRAGDPAGEVGAGEPLFPGYVFCRFDRTVPGLIVTTPGVIRIVGFGQGPAAIPDAEIEAILTIEKSGLPVAPHPYLQSGDRVRIGEGPLQGLEGKVMALGKKNLFVVSVTLLQRSVAVEISLQSLIRLETDREVFVR
jgi:transcriptional antiterminator NusG